MAIQFFPDVDASTPCRIFFSLVGSDAAPLTITNTQLLAVCVDGPLKTFLSTAVSSPSDAGKNLRVTFVPQGVTPNTNNPDANIPNWGVDLLPDGSFKLTVLAVQSKATAAGPGTDFVAGCWLEYVHSLVR
jgi:hypothetical protein